MRQCLLLLALLLGVSAETGKIHKFNAVKRSRSLKSDRARVNKHLKTLLARAPEAHKAAIAKELDTTVDYPEIEAWYGSPLTLDWIVDVYFDDALATAYKVILDSGSSNLAIATSSCSNCGEAATTLDLSEASPSMCIEVEYGSGSWSGVELASTYVALSSDASTEVTLAGITDQDDFFEGGSSYSGILGMAYEGIANGYYSDLCDTDDDSTSTTSSSSSSRKGSRGVRGSKDTTSTSTSTDSEVADTPLMYALYENGVIASNAFGVKMCGDSAEVSIGGVDSTAYTGDLTLFDTQKTFSEYYGYYLVYASSITVGTTSVTVEDINKYGGLVVDTGTTLHYLPTATVTAIETEIKSSVSSVDTDFFEWSSCIDSDTLSDFPTITYTFAASSDSGATTTDIHLEPFQYLLSYDDCYYWGFEASSLGIFGNIGMVHRVMYFDITNNQVGIADAVCTDDDDSSSTSTLDAKARNQAPRLSAVVASSSSTELFMGSAAALAVVGAVVGSVFAVVRKFKSASADTEETKSLLPPL